MITHGTISFHPQQGMAVDLRPMLLENINDLQRMLSHPEVRPHIQMRHTTGSPYEYFEKLVNRMLYGSDPCELHAGIYLQGQQRLIGTASLQNWNRREGKASLGYMVDPTWWGKGLATEAVGLFLKYAFHELGVTRVEGRCRGNNYRSERVMTKNGMRLERILPQVGTLNDVIKVFTLLHK